jgi:hypothetical protein
MTLDKIYRDILGQLELGKRPQIELTPELAQELLLTWNNGRQKASPELLLPCLCLLEHTKKSFPEWGERLIHALPELPTEEIKIFALGALSSHVFVHSELTGQRIPFSLVLSLRELILNSKGPELLEWCLRTVERMGPLGVQLKEEMNATRPAQWRRFDSRYRSIFELYKLLDKRWLGLTGVPRA